MDKLIASMLFASAIASALPASAAEPRQMENLGRGVVALNQGEGKVYVSWRLLGTDPDDISFNVYRQIADTAPVKLTPQPIANVTFFQDTQSDLAAATSYFVRPVINGVEAPASKPWKLAAGAPAQQYISIPIQKLPQGYSLNDCTVGDLDGDGEYEIIVHETGRSRDNSQAGITDPPIFQAYKLDGTLLWTINLGKNIREGAHYTQMMCYDLDGDGRAELVLKTADGSTDGLGNVIGDKNANYVAANGYVLTGPEFLSVFDGLTGKVLTTIDYIPQRGTVASWGDAYGNRLDRYLACIAYLDGVHPSVVMCRGYYTRTVLAAFDWNGSKLSSRWVFDSANPAKPEYATWRGQGNHGISVADVDGDGTDEIIYGAMAINHDGSGLYNTKLGHGDAMHVSDMDPDRPGLEVFDIHENPRHPYGIEFRDAKTGALIWGKPGGTNPSPDVGRGVAFDIDPRTKGYECWSSLPGLYDCKGNLISNAKPREVNFGVWWDGDPLRELLDGNHISKWNWLTSTESTLLAALGCSSNNGTKSTPALCADILGDWREEVIWRTTDNKELRIYNTTIPTDRRIYTLMHDPQYRLAVAWQNVAYNQPPHPGFYLGDGMKAPPKPNITLVKPK